MSFFLQEDIKLY